jgi:hypothetical protein
LRRRHQRHSAAAAVAAAGTRDVSCRCALRWFK